MADEGEGDRIYFLYFTTATRLNKLESEPTLSSDYEDGIIDNESWDWYEEQHNRSHEGEVYLLKAEESTIDSQKVKDTATRELKTILVERAFQELDLPNVKVVESPSGEPSLEIVASNDSGLPKWEWNFKALDSKTSCVVECSGLVEVKTAPMKMDSHVIKYEMACDLVEFADDCFIDCRESEMEAEEECIRGEVEYDSKGVKIIDYNMQTVAEINSKATEIVQKMLNDKLRIQDDFDFKLVNTEEEKKQNLKLNTPVVLSSLNKDGMLAWEWNFTSKDCAWECNIECVGSITITKKQSLHPLAIKFGLGITAKKRKRQGDTESNSNNKRVQSLLRRQSATKAARRRKSVRTVIVGLGEWPTWY